MNSEYFTIMWNGRSWSKWNEPLPTTPNANLHSMKVVLYIWWGWKGVLYYELLLEKKIINSKMYHSELDQLKAAFDKKHPELVNSSVQFSSVAQSCLTLRSHEPQHAWPPCPSSTPGVHPNLCPLSR